MSSSLRRCRFGPQRCRSQLSELIGSIIVNLLAGSLLGAWFGAGWATRLSSKNLYRVIAILLGIIAAILLFGHDVTTAGALFSGFTQIAVGVIAGFAIGVVASLLGVAGGEPLIPTLILSVWS